MINKKDNLINVTINKADNTDLNTFFYKKDFNPKVIRKNLSLYELKVYVRLKFKSSKEAANAAGISETRVRQILIGYHLPKTSKLINQIAKGWDIDPVKLTLLFENGKKEDEKKETN